GAGRLHGPPRAPAAAPGVSRRRPGVRYRRGDRRPLHEQRRPLPERLRHPLAVPQPQGGAGLRARPRAARDAGLARRAHARYRAGGKPRRRPGGDRRAPDASHRTPLRLHGRRTRGGPAPSERTAPPHHPPRPRRRRARAGDGPPDARLPAALSGQREDDMPHRAGLAAIVGRPNVGKSTLLNALVGTKVAIVTPKPQTTRNRIVGIRTLPEAQIAFLDTPGLHEARSLLNRRMVDVAQQTLGEADVVLLVVDATTGVSPADRELAARLAGLRATSMAVLNKRDRVRPPALLPAMAALGECLPGRDVFPTSARTGEQVDAVLAAVVAALPAGPRLYPEDEYTTETERFLVQETIREQLFLQTEEEVPYGTAVEAEEFAEQPAPNLLVVRAT